MKGFDAYRCHQAMSLHFNKKTNYDYFKYNGSVSVKKITLKSIRINGNTLALKIKLIRSYGFTIMPTNQTSLHILLFSI